MNNITTRWILYLFATFMMISGCAFHPLGISDDQWEAMTIEQKQAAYEKQQKIDQKQLELREKAQALEQKRLENQRRNEKPEQEETTDHYSGRVIHHRGGTIGGDRGDQKQLIISWGEFRWIDRVDFYAHDNIDGGHNGVMNIKADHYSVASHVDIKKRGQHHSFYVGRRCRNLIFESAANDRIAISKIQIYGSPW